MGTQQFQFRGSDRFRVIRQLGEGGMGVVYEAEDRQRGQLVAIKTLKDNDVDTLARLKHEFRALTDLSHPNLVDLYEMLVDETSSFFTMELIEGGNVVDYCRTEAVLAAGPPSRADTDPALSVDMVADRRPGSADVSRLRVVLPQLVRGLLALHEAGLVHRDIKPSNVLVTHSSRVVLLDFGLVTGARDWANDSLHGRIVGTVEYMAPEQAAGETARPAADWYAVGCLLYEILTGQPPFQGPPMQVLVAKQEQTPPAPSAIVGDLPADLDALCQELLQLDAEARPTGYELLARLEGKLQSVRTPKRTISIPAENPPFVGREVELARLEAAFEEVEAGRGIAVAVQGPSGIGKTSLVRHLLAELRARDEELVVFEGRCFESETVPFKAIDSIIDQLARYWGRLPASEAAELLPGHAGLLAALFPVFGRVPAIAAAPRHPVDGDPHELRGMAFSALRHVLRRLAVKRRLVLFLDDLQWADADSLTLLAELMRPPRDPALMLILGGRREDTVVDRAAGSASIECLLDELGLSLESIDLGPLDGVAASEVVHELLPGTADEEAERIVREARGVPFFLTELALFTLTVPQDDAHPVTLEGLLRARIERLPESARELMQLVSIAGQPISQRVAASALETSPESLARIIRHLRTVHLLRAPGGRATDRVECYHNRIRETVLAGISASRRQSYHRSLAIALEQWNEASLEQLARHWDGAGEWGKAAANARLAAADAAGVFDFFRAARLYQIALDLGDFRVPERRGLQRKLADALARAGRPAEAAAAYIEAVEGAPAVEALELRHLGAVSLLRGGYVSEGLHEIAGVLGELDLGLASSTVRSRFSTLWRRGYLRAFGTRVRPRPEADLPPRVLVKMDVCAEVATALSVIDPVRAFEYQTRHLAMARRSGEPKRLSRALALEACFLTSLRRFARAESFARSAEMLAQDAGDERALPHVSWARGAIALYRDSAWQSALDHFREASEHLRRQNLLDSWEMGTVRWHEFVCRLALGEIAELRARADDFVRGARRRGDLHGAGTVNLSLSRLWLALGRIGQVEDVVAATDDLPREARLHHLWAWVARSQLALYRGDAGACRELLGASGERRRDHVERVPIIENDICAMEARLCLAVAAATSGAKQRRLIARARRSSDRLRRFGSPIDAILATAIEAEMCGIEGRLEEMVGHLGRALGDAERRSSVPLAQAIRYRLGGLSGDASGRAMRREALAWMSDQEVAEPERFVRLFVVNDGAA